MAIDAKVAINDVLQVMDTVGAEMVGKLGGMDGFGFKLLCILFGVMFFYYIVIFMIEGGNRIMVDLTKLLLTWALLASMLIGWTGATGGEGPMSSVSVKEFFLVAIPSIADEFTGGRDPTAEVVDKHVQAIGALYTFLSPPENSSQSIVDKIINVVPMVGFSAIAHYAMGTEATGNALENAGWLSILVSTVLVILSAFFVLWSLMTFVFVLNAGQMMMYVGLAIGPILIPFLLIPKLSFLFDGWMKFMISASLFKVIAVLVGLLAMAIVDGIVRYSVDTSTASENLIFLSLMILFFSMLGKHMMGMADNIAQALATGGTSAGDGGHTSIITVAARTKLPSRTK